MREHRHNTDEQVLDALRVALSVVEDAKVPDELREIAFSKAVDLLSAKQVFYTQEDAQPLGIDGLTARRVLGH